MKQKTKSRKKRSRKKQTKIKVIFDNLKGISAMVFAGLALLYFPYLFFKNKVIDNLLDNNSIKVKAVIINEKNYWGNGSLSRTFSYSYKYTVEGQVYKKDSRDTDLRIGEKIWIEYSTEYPSFSRIIKEQE